MAANKDMVTRGFKKCGVSIAIDGSEENEIHMKDLKDYDFESDDNKSICVSSESNDSSESDCSSDIHNSIDDCTIALFSEFVDNSQALPTLSVTIIHDCNQLIH